jgi:TolA-binding protein
VHKHTIALTATLFMAASALAQGPIRLPELSPAASAAQTIGVTDVNVTYHRPAVNKRRIWGGLVPYGTVWRAGANEGTTLAFSTPVTFQGKEIPAGTYGLFMIPGPTDWTVMLSRFAGGWGAYMYDPSEDVARVTVTPQTMSENQERLAYEFDDLANDGATLALRWEKLRVPIRISVDLPSTVRASISGELRGAKHWNSSAWAAAARWELRNGNTDAALKDADRALGLEVTTTSLQTKASVLAKQGDAKGAAALRERAKESYTPAETMYNNGFALLGQKKPDEAIAFENRYIQEHPDGPELWRAYAVIGQAWSEKGDAAKSQEAFDKAMAAAHDQADRTEVQDFINSIAARL